MNAFYIFIGGGLGSLLRYAISLASMKWMTNSFPLGTLFSNFFACCILGLVAFVLMPKYAETNWIHPFVVVGICGGFSTFSTFSMETISLFQNDQTLLGILNILISICSCFGILYLINTNVK
jgi:CrcB protein